MCGRSKPLRPLLVMPALVRSVQFQIGKVWLCRHCCMRLECILALPEAAQMPSLWTR